ncbi:MAG: polyprenyl synthetase family protein [Dehalococcoidia bacterium]
MTGLLDAVRAELSRQVLSSGLPRKLQAEILQESPERSGVLLSGHPATLAALPLAAFESAGGGLASLAASAGAAMEFLLAAGDVLDDMQDAAGPPDEGGPAAFHAELISALLVLSQGALLGIAGDSIPGRRVLKGLSILNQLEVRALAGQHVDVSADGAAVSSISDSLATTVAKSGSLGRCAGMIGAALATDDVDVIDKHGKFGEHLGTVYQLMNDIDAVWPGGSESTDLSLGRSTPPISFARLSDLNADAAVAAFMDAVSGGKPSSKDMEVRVRKALLESGGIHFAWVQASIHRARAMAIAEDIRKTNSASRLDIFFDK